MSYKSPESGRILIDPAAAECQNAVAPMRGKGRLMADAYIVHLDLEQLRATRSREEHRDLSDGELQSWLVRYGFYPRTDGLFLAEESVLRQLDPDSVLDVQPVESD